jgi:hypothetical protein
MKTHDFELLSQYLDGELNREAALSLEQRLTAEPELRETLERLGTLDEAIRQAFRGTELLPAGAGALLESASTPVVPLPRRGGALWHYAMAASLVAVVVSLVLSEQWQQSRTARGPDTLLSSVLEQTPSRGEGWEILEDGRRIRPVLTWADRTGSWCREYLLSDRAGNWRGIACRKQGQWETRVIGEAAAEAAADQYRPAGTSDAGAIASFMESQAADIPLSKAEESEVIARGWR